MTIAKHGKAKRPEKEKKMNQEIDYRALWMELKGELEENARGRFYNLSPKAGGDNRLDYQMQHTSQYWVERMEQIEILSKCK